MSINSCLDKIAMRKKIDDEMRQMQAILAQITALKAMTTNLLGSFDREQICKPDKPIASVTWGLTINSYANGKVFVSCYPMSKNAKGSKKPKDTKVTKLKKEKQEAKVY